MNIRAESNHEIVERQQPGAGRRTLLKMAATGLAMLGMLATGGAAWAADTLKWDKTFPKSERVDQQKVSFYNRLGINIVADLYIPKNLDRSQKHPAIVVGPPYGGVKEQRSCQKITC